jgi:hypothetical protein
LLSLEKQFTFCLSNILAFIFWIRTFLMFWQLTILGIEYQTNLFLGPLNFYNFIKLFQQFMPLHKVIIIIID